MLGTVLWHGAILFIGTGLRAIALFFLVYYFRVQEDSAAFYVSVSLGIALFIGSISSTIVAHLYGTLSEVSE
jgi:hypothetical protein